MLKRSVISALVLVFAAMTASSLWAQNDNRQWPVFPYDADVNYVKEPPNIRKKRGMLKFVPEQYPPEAYKYSAPKERILMSEAGVEVVNMTPVNLDQAETWISINPTNNLNAIAGSNDSRFNSSGNYFMVAYFTKDGGRTWDEQRLPAVPADLINDQFPQRATNFDPGIDFDSQGRAFYVWGKTQTSSGDLEGDNGIFISYSDDGGESWADAIPVTLNLAEDNIFDDKFLITADDRAGSSLIDNVYIVWTRFDRNPGRSNEIMLARTDGGGDPEEWSTTVVPSNGSGGAIQSPLAAIGPNGELYVTWRSGNGTETNAMLNASTDGGKSWRWSSAQVAQTVQTTGVRNSESGRFTLADKQNMRISSYPAIEVDVSGGDHHGRIYIVQSGRVRPSDTDQHVLLTWSDDGGASWTDHIEVDDNETAYDVFMPSISVDPTSGHIAVFYYSSQNGDESNTAVDAYVAISTDGAQTFRRIRLTDESWFIDGSNDVSNQGVGNFYWGDYTAIDFRDGRILPCWWMPNAPNGSYTTLDAYTALLSTAPKPVTAEMLNNPAENPTRVELSWTDPTETQLGEPLGAFSVVIMRSLAGQDDAQELGRVDAGVQAFADETAVDGLSYDYMIVVEDASGERSPAVTLSVAVGGELEPKAPQLIVGVSVETGVIVRWTNPTERIDGSVFADFNRVELLKDGQVIATFDQPAQLELGATVEALVDGSTLALNQFHEVQMRAVAKRGDFETASVPSNTVLVYSGPAIPAANYSESFENGGSFPFYSNGTWGIYTNSVAYDGASCITDSPDGDYSNVADSRLITPPIEIDASTTSFEFAHIGIIDGGTNDFGFIMVSNDYGQTWNFVAGVEQTDHPDLWTTDVTASSWVLDRRSLADYEGETVMIMFQLVSNGFRQRDGWYVDALSFNSLPVSVNDSDPIAYGLRLDEAQPNPASGFASIDYATMRPGRVKLELYNSMGQRVAVLQDAYLNAGIFSAEVDATQFADGVYYYRLSMDGRQLVKALTIIH